MPISYELPRNQSRLANTDLLRTVLNSRVDTPLEFQLSGQPQSSVTSRDTSNLRITAPWVSTPHYTTLVNKCTSPNFSLLEGLTLVTQSSALGHLYLRLVVDVSKLPEEHRSEDLILQLDSTAITDNSALLRTIEGVEDPTSLTPLPQDIVNAELNSHGQSGMVFFTNMYQLPQKFTAQNSLADGGELQISIQIAERIILLDRPTQQGADSFLLAGPSPRMMDAIRSLGVWGPAGGSIGDI